MKIYVAGHGGMVGSSLCRSLKKKGYSDVIVRSREQLNLCEQQAVNNFIKSEKPEYIFIAAAKVGGIYANNKFRADFIYQNIIIAANLIHAAAEFDVERVMFFGSSCIYPRDCKQPMDEQDLLTGALEYTNEPYAIAKIAGIKLCESYNSQYGTKFVSVIPNNLFGPNDNYDPLSSHVIPAFIVKAHEAKTLGLEEFAVWGSGSPKREFLYVDDLADACVELMKSNVDEGLYNIGTGEDVSIKDLAQIVADVVGFEGRITFDTSKPDGMPRKLMNSAKIKKTGWTPKVNLYDGIRLAYQDYLNNRARRIIR